MSYVNNVASAWAKLTSVYPSLFPTDYVRSERSLHKQEAKLLYSVLAFVLLLVYECLQRVCPRRKERVPPITKARSTLATVVK